MAIPVSFRGGNRALLLRHTYYKTRGMLFRSLWHKIWHWRRVAGLALIHSSVELYYPDKLFLGEWAVLHRNGKLNALSRRGVHVGRRVTLADNFWIQGTSHLSDLGEELMICDGTYIGPNAILGFHGRVWIGCKCAIGANFQISAQSHDLSAVEEIAVRTEKSKGIIIGNQCWIGNDVKILDGVTIGNNSVIGAGSVVTKDIPAMCVAAGVPARVLRNR